MSPFFFNDTATTEIYTLSLHDALPISRGVRITRPSPPSITRPIKGWQRLWRAAARRSAPPTAAIRIPTTPLSLLTAFPLPFLPAAATPATSPGLLAEPLPAARAPLPQAGLPTL